MGYALAGAARHEGHDVLLISGPTALDVPPGVDFIHTESAQQMYEAVRDTVAGVDIALLCAAVADYRPVKVAEQKIKKGENNYLLELERTPDILAAMRTDFGFNGILVGFAAETQDLIAHAREKLRRKGCNMIVANDVSRSGVGFGTAENEVVLVLPDREIQLPRETKEWLAMRIIEQALAMVP